MQPLPELNALIANIPGLSDATVRHELGGGNASDCWLVENHGKQDHGKQWVVRVDRPLARALGLDRKRELKVLETVSAAGIGPDVIWADPAAGVLVTAYIPAPVWREESLHEPARLQQLARTLRRLHDLPATGPDFDPAQAALTYADAIGGDAAADLATRAGALARQLLTSADCRSLCHNDLVYANILGSDPVRLIDWEYASMGDPLFDLAVVVSHHRLNSDIATGFLNACLGRPNGRTLERFDAFCELYDLLARLWYMAAG